MADPTKVFAGSRARFKIDANIIGFAGGVSGEEMVDYEPVDVLDLLEVREHVPVAYRCSMNAQMFRVVVSPLKQYGDGNVEVFPKQDNILTRGDMVAAIEDSVTATTIMTMQSVKCAGHSWDVTARGIVSENVNFVCIRATDEAEL
jgi:hypothetical protein